MKFQSQHHTETPVWRGHYMHVIHKKWVRGYPECQHKFQLTSSVELQPMFWCHNEKSTSCRLWLVILCLIVEVLVRRSLFPSIVTHALLTGWGLQLGSSKNGLCIALTGFCNSMLLHEGYRILGQPFLSTLTWKLHGCRLEFLAMHSRSFVFLARAERVLTVFPEDMLNHRVCCLECPMIDVGLGKTSCPAVSQQWRKNPLYGYGSSVIVLCYPNCNW